MPEPLDPFLEWVPVGDSGNAPDTETMFRDGSSGYGIVRYPYFIGKFEVTCAQYTEFLNAVAKSDPNGLYHIRMGHAPLGFDYERTVEIVRAGEEGSYTYSVGANFGDKPITVVDFYDAARLHNGRPRGPQGATTTEGGAYTMTGEYEVLMPGTDLEQGEFGLALGAFGRNAGAKYFVPSENEWYKAAYYDPTIGDVGGYWLYATQSDDAPTGAVANATGDIINDSPNIANYTGSVVWNGAELGSGNVTTVGSGGPGNASYYGAFDMSGNVYEVTDHLYMQASDAFGYRARGGAFYDDSGSISSRWWILGGGPPTLDNGNQNHGFTQGQGITIRVAARRPIVQSP